MTLQESDPAHHELSEFIENLEISALLNSPEYVALLEDEEFHKKVEAVCRQVVRAHRAEATYPVDDLKQDILIKFGPWLLKKYRREAKLETVLTRVAVNQLIDDFRRRNAKRRAHEEIDLDRFEQMPEEARDTLALPEVCGEIFVAECRGKLSDDERGIFDEYLFEGRSMGEIAAKRGVKRQAVSKKWSRILKKLEPLAGNTPARH